MSSIATQHGDGGRTRLIGGAQVSKSDLRVEAYGAIDELGAGLGFARSITVRHILPLDQKLPLCKGSNRPPPRQTGRAEIPHPAFLKTLAARHTEFTET